MEAWEPFVPGYNVYAMGREAGLWGGGEEAAGRAASAAERASREEWLGLREDVPEAYQLAPIGAYAEEAPRFLGGPSPMEEAYADPMAVEAQRQALQRMQQIAMEGGLTPEDRARIAESQAQARTFERGQREAILAQQQARGMGGAGTTLAAQLGAQQAGAQQLSQQQLGIEALAQQRALQALQSQAGMAGQLRGMSFEEEAARRRAQEEASRYNLSYQREAHARDVERRRRVSELQAQAVGQRFGMQRDVTAGISGQYSAEAQRQREKEREEAESKRQAWGAGIGLAQGLGGM
jgi:hypothetical protein